MICQRPAQVMQAVEKARGWTIEELKQIRTENSAKRGGFEKKCGERSLQMDEKDDLMARTVVENLSIGINPLTGRALPPSDCCANEVVQEALKTVLEHCSLESYASILERQRKEKEASREARKERRVTRYPNTGQPWTREEEEKLYDLYFRRKNNIWGIADILKRSPGSISARLKKLGY